MINSVRERHLRRYMSFQMRWMYLSVTVNQRLRQLQLWPIITTSKRLRDERPRYVCEIVMRFYFLATRCWKQWSR